MSTQARVAARPTAGRLLSEPTVRCRRFKHPANRAEYLPDPMEPVDRWYQAANSSNVRTTLRILHRLGPGRPTLIVDPFAGAGSSAVAARSLRLPFFGVDADPVLACVTMAKTFATVDHARKLSSRLGAPTDTDDPVLNCLDLVRQLRAAAGTPLPVADIVADLGRCPAPHRKSEVFWGDATSAGSWSGVPAVFGRKVIYCSPPFGASSPRPVVPEELTRHAQWILTAAGRSRVHQGPAEFGRYGDLAGGMLRQAKVHLGNATVILEYEPPDGPFEDRLETVHRLRRETGANIDQLYVTQAFSARGELCLIRGELRPEQFHVALARRGYARNTRD